MVFKEGPPSDREIADFVRRILAPIDHLKNIDPDRFVQNPTANPQILVPPRSLVNVDQPDGDMVAGAPIVTDSEVLPPEVETLMPIAPAIPVGRDRLAIQPHISPEDKQLYIMLMRLNHRTQDGLMPFAYEDTHFDRRKILEIMQYLGMPDDEAHLALRAGFAQSLLVVAEQRSQLAALFQALNAMYLDPTITSGKITQHDGGFRWGARSREGEEVSFERGPSTVHAEFQREPPVIVQMPEQSFQTVIVEGKRGRSTFYGVKSQVLHGHIDSDDIYGMQVREAIGNASKRGGKWWTE
ncbi:hypothetical protein KKB64_02315 [Patescibacteria group bacterium]|nr:hypothetical protein [Patescibacteria group bacterium]MBU1472603.1 hypothetical protein [Patescibacteria group bacterium]MBU2459854.1 hypothetical protein [Patescibacteria group bacterium]MBU2544085.1 hypothetical protein [Patescibacteria group bacterium]